MKIQILSNRKKHNGLDEYTKRRVEKVNCFLYDEDCFWFDYKGERFGISIDQIMKLRKKQIDELNEIANTSCEVQKS